MQHIFNIFIKKNMNCRIIFILFANEKGQRENDSLMAHERESSESNYDGRINRRKNIALT